MPYTRKNITITKAYFARLRAQTQCQYCGAQPIDWHHINGAETANHRVSSMAARGVPIHKLEEELAKCIPLCRSCHITAHRHVPPQPCIKCAKLAKPLRKGLCNACYLRMKAYPYHSYASTCRS